MEFFIYRHIRPDKKEVFYIGIGTIINAKTYKKNFKRAYSKDNRNKHWHNIVNFINKKYEVEIIFKSISRDEIQKKEKEFIKLYGRQDLGLGTLCNMTDGGDNPILSEETKYKIGNSKFHKKTKRPVFVYNSSGFYLSKYNSISECYKDLNIDKAQAQRVLHGKSNFVRGYFLTFVFKGEKIKFKNKCVMKKNINQLDDNGNIVNTYNCQREAAKKIKCNRYDLMKKINTGEKYKGFYFKYNNF